MFLALRSLLPTQTKATSLKCSVPKVRFHAPSLFLSSLLAHSLNLLFPPIRHQTHTHVLLESSKVKSLRKACEADLKAQTGRVSLGVQRATGNDLR
jgi:hypothetical protein